MAKSGRKSSVVIRDRGMIRIKKAISRVDGYSVKVGIPEGAGNYPNGGPPIAEVAIRNEYGIGPPERPFMRQAVDSNRRNLTHKLVRAAREVTMGVSPEEAMGRVGEWLLERVRESILKGNFTPLAESTIRKKGHADPLIETDLLYDSLTSAVVPPQKRGRRA